MSFERLQSALRRAKTPLALGIAQNYLSPLQREQSKQEQMMSNGFSIGISLFLGAFVSLGVGIYWIASNLFAIAQLYLLNMAIPPKKYVDYEALEASREELAQLNAMVEKKKPFQKDPNAKRERARCRRVCYHIEYRA